jgi:hypothetical protein
VPLLHCVYYSLNNIMKATPKSVFSLQSYLMLIGIKVKFTLEQATKAQRGGCRYSCTLSLTSALEGGGWSMPRPGHFTTDKAPVLIV